MRSIIVSQDFTDNCNIQSYICLCCENFSAHLKLSVLVTEINVCSYKTPSNIILNSTTCQSICYCLYNHQCTLPILYILFKHIDVFCNYPYLNLYRYFSLNRLNFNNIKLNYMIIQVKTIHTNLFCNKIVCFNLWY